MRGCEKIEIPALLLSFLHLQNFIPSHNGTQDVAGRVAILNLQIKSLQNRPNSNFFTASELFEGKIVYNPDTYRLFYDAQARLKRMSLDELYDLMDFVKTKHTYLNRIEVILNFISS